MCIFLQRMDLGDCPKIHDLALRADFENASRSKDYFYDIDVSPSCFDSVFIVWNVELIATSSAGH